ncbi:Cof-type HAD-IIB family hydrolase [Mycoplasma miroungirhinis]|uniref:HAD family phosphatase n=1 Tax=Mycoplasma miroungirhinis TaxID=754516 RepID=A0A6M4JHK4_9MOLU|nr:HAD family hydrolase [Mycoplasma miroungirhinis]QJR43911.1 HAD family phosphatase [Mycoplasma miroungirhinis]
MEFRPQAIFVDLDGTLVDLKNNNISTLNITTIQNINKKIPCFISTGRGLSKSLLETTNMLGLNYGIAQNGAIIFDKVGNIIKKHTINKASYLNIIDLLTAAKFSFIINSQKIIYSDTLLSKIIKFFKKEYIVQKNLQAKNIDEVTKILVISSKIKRLAELKKLLLKEFIDINVVSIANNHALEITDINATKGKANSFICSLINIDPLKAIHIGDSMNDASVIHYLGGLIAMKNANPELKKLATIIGFHHKKSGVAKTLNKLIKL